MILFALETPNRTFFTKRLKTNVKVFLTFVILAGLVAFAERKQTIKRCSQIDIAIGDTYNNYFINDEDVLTLMTKGGTEKLIGKPYQRIDFKNLESRVKTNKFVRTCEISRDLRGELRVEIQQNRPIARLVHRYAPDAYVSDNGAVLPLSDRYTARVLIVEGDRLEPYLNNGLMASDEGKALFDLVQFIDQHPFWQKQIAQVFVDDNHLIRLYPQIGREVIEFGTATDIAPKFDKLLIFYKQILPAKGWNTYSRVSLAFQNQIICE